MEHHVGPRNQIRLHERLVVSLQLVKYSSVFQKGQLVLDPSNYLPNYEVLMDKYKEEALDKRIALHGSECWDAYKDLLDEGSHEFSFILEVFITFRQFLREVSICSLLLNTVFPPYLGHLQPSWAHSLLVFDLGELEHLLVERLYLFTS